MAFDKAHEYQIYVRADWSKISITAVWFQHLHGVFLTGQQMKLVLRAKFSQHTNLMQMLVDTGDAQLVENSPYDAFWGIGRDGTGQNQLGLLLQEIRTELRANAISRSPFIISYVSFRFSRKQFELGQTSKRPLRLRTPNRYSTDDECEDC
jgi:hypothetical protein